MSLTSYAQNEAHNALWNRMLDARDDLQYAQDRIANLRQRGLDHGFLWGIARRRFYTALDRAWEAQCMAQGSY
jgi:hypothetical protein